MQKMPVFCKKVSGCHLKTKKEVGKNKEIGITVGKKNIYIIQFLASENQKIIHIYLMIWYNL